MRLALVALLLIGGCGVVTPHMMARAQELCAAHGGVKWVGGNANLTIDKIDVACLDKTYLTIEETRS